MPPRELGGDRKKGNTLLAGNAISAATSSERPALRQLGEVG